MGVTPLNELEFEKAAFWVRMFNLPLACMGKEMGHRIGATIGEVKEVDVTNDGVGWGEYLRVGICLDLSKPLSRGRFLTVRDKEIWVAFQYEKIPKFCFKCGTIRHGSRDCDRGSGRRIQGADDENQFGPWLRVPSPKKHHYEASGRWDKGKKKESSSEESSFRTDGIAGRKGTGSGVKTGGWSSERSTTPVDGAEGIPRMQKSW